MQNELPIISIVGRPNVGKSTLFNRLVGRRVAVVAREAGTTRDRVVERAHWNQKEFLVCDTAGLLVDFTGFKEEEIEKMAQEQIDRALEDSDIILFVIDAKSGFIPEDMEVARKIRKFGKKVYVVLNKADNESLERKSLELGEYGFEAIIPVSAISGRRSGDLLDKITSGFKVLSEDSNKNSRLAIVGRPNVGKSTLFNLLVGEERSIVSNVAGTTRDSICLTISLKNKSSNKAVEIIDTAGFKKRGGITPGIEKFSIMRSVQAVFSADLILLLVDSSVGLTRTDAHLGQLALSNNKHLLIVLNKIDLLANKTKDEIPNLNRFSFLTKIKIVAISAKSGENIELLKKEILKEL